jgi:hypothetical protein
MANNDQFQDSASSAPNLPSLVSAKDFQNTPEGWQERWKAEMGAAHKETQDWHKRADRIIARFLDKRGIKEDNSWNQRLNLFTANIQTLRAIMYGKTPQVTVTRRFEDANDDIARVTGEMLERLLNADIERDNDSYAGSLSMALDDKLTIGLGNCRVRYVVDFEEVVVDPIFGQQKVTERETETDSALGVASKGHEAMEGATDQSDQENEVNQKGQPLNKVEDKSQGQTQPKPLADGFTQERKVPGSEDVEVDYVNWRDQRWSPARTWNEVRWWAFKASMSRDECVERFGKKLGKEIPFAKKASAQNYYGDAVNAAEHDPWGRADVWEIWSKEQGKVFWFNDGMDVILDVKDDPLGLEGFWPFPKPMVSNATTSSFMPRPEFLLAQDLYDEVDVLSTRINMIQRAIKVVGVYDRSSTGVQRMLTEGVDNELIPIDNWAMFAEKGGIKGVVDFLPIEQLAAALQILQGVRQETISLLYQVTGMADIMRGASEPGATATEQAIKARFASVRIQALQDEFARFASDLQRIKAEIISKHFEPQTILDRSNLMNTPDAQYAQQAIALVKDYRKAAFRVEVKPEAVSLTDFAALKQERMEFVQALGGLIQQAAPLAQVMPGSMPFVLEIVKWAMAGFKGASSIEGVLDQAITAAQQQSQQQAAQGPPPDPKLEAEKMKAQTQMQATQMKAQVDAQGHQMKSVSEQRRIQAETQSELARIQAQTQADLLTRQQDAEFNLQETLATTRAKALSNVNKVTGGK